MNEELTDLSQLSDDELKAQISAMQAELERRHPPAPKGKRWSESEPYNFEDRSADNRRLLAAMQANQPKPKEPRKSSQGKLEPLSDDVKRQIAGVFKTEPKPWMKGGDRSTP